MLPYAPGSRVVIRDEEWLVRRIDPSSDGGHLLTCDGVSELIKGREGLFLTEMEDEVKVLDPATTELEFDDSSHFDRSFLYLEAKMRRSTPNDERIHLGSRAVMKVLPYQLDPAIQALRQPRQRILIADAVGLGKTLEAGILATELIQRGRGRRILVITQKSMLTQFQKEFWSRFTIPLVRLDSQGLQRVRNNIPSNHNPFNHYDRTIISIDTLKTNLEYRNYLENAWWDIIIIDECHNVAARAGEDSLSSRARLARLLARRSDTLILLSATPHDGSARSFASLMSLLDPTAISDPEDYTPEDFRDKGLVVRRFKKDIKDQVKDDFKERITEQHSKKATKEEDEAFKALLAIPFTQSGAHHSGKKQELQRVAMQKGLFSSPAAALDSTIRRIAILESDPNSSTDVLAEISALKIFKTKLEAIGPSQFSRYNQLVELLKSSKWSWDPSKPNDRLVIFSERLETLRWLKEHLPSSVGISADKVVVLDGGMTDTEQQEVVDRFGREDDPIRVLLCSDVASEGLNLHYFCHRLIHFDLPWSLMVFQQRNGRVDRYGQTQQPLISYLFTQTDVEKIKGDFRILEILQEKDDQAAKNLGDPSSLLNVHDAEKEAQKVAEAMASGSGPDAFGKKLDDAQKSLESGTGQSEGDDWLIQLCEPTTKLDVDSKKGEESLNSVFKRKSIFGTERLSSDFHFVKTALQVLQSEPGRNFQYTFDDFSESLSFTAPVDLKERFKTILPLEVRETQSQYHFSARSEEIEKAIKAARQQRKEEDTWPNLHYLWPQHPFMEWLSDRVLARFGRLKAPVITSTALPKGSHAFLVMGLIPNKKGQPLLVDWQAVIFDGKSYSLEPLSDFLERYKLKAGTLPNSGRSPSLDLLKSTLPAAIDVMKNHVIDKQKSFSAEIQERLAKHLANLEALQGRQINQLELRLNENKQAESFKASIRQRKTEDISKVFTEYSQWVEDTLTIEPSPFIEVLAAVTHP
jgi:superfamily II DNA or RNA helicase